MSQGWGSRRVRIGGALAVAVAIGVGAGILVAVSGKGPQRQLPSASAAHGLQGLVRWPAGRRPAPNFALRDQRDRLTSLVGQRGRVVVLAFLDSHCHAACPVEGRELAVAERAVPRAAPITLLVVSVEPWADTPKSATAAAR